MGSTGIVVAASASASFQRTRRSHSVQRSWYEGAGWLQDGGRTTLAETIETWWPAIEVFLTTGLTNAGARTG
jgi:hypothetical protein